MQQYPEINALGELVCLRSDSNYSRMLASIAPGNSLLIDMPPAVPSYWDEALQVWVKKPEQPSPRHTWRAQTRAWTDDRSLDEAKADKIAEMRIERDRADAAQINIGGYSYDAHPAAMAAICQELQLAALTPTAVIQWTLANNLVQSHTLPQLRAVAVAIRARNTASRARYEARRASISTATTADAVSLLVW
jgi:hypothetical protein